jgi:DNA-binding protein HU-beta
MNKGDLVEAVAGELGESKAVAARAIQAVIGSITNGLKQEDAVTITGFGTFTKKHRPARTGTNPATGQPMALKASRTVGFRASQSLKDSL